MTTAEERMRILNMIQEGRVTAEEGARLLEALGNHGKTAPSAHTRHIHDHRQLHVRITDLATGKTKVDVNVPMSLVHVGIKLGARFMPDSVDFDGIMETVREGASGQIVDMEDAASGEHIEVWVE